MNKNDKSILNLALVLALVFSAALLGMNGLWLMDISVSAMLNDVGLTNGFWNVNPMQAFHIGMYMIDIAVVITAILGIIAVYFIVMYYGIGSPHRTDR